MNYLSKQKAEIKLYNPEKDKRIKGDPYKTIFVGKLNYKTDERKLEDTFQKFGDIRRVRIIRDPQSNKSKGYGFIEFQEARGAEMAYNKGDGRKIDDCYVLVDKELARIDKYWLPRRLGGGKGGRRN